MQRSPIRLLQVGLAAADPYKIPAAWDGVWDSSDSTYDCGGAFQQTDTNLDTLCSGAVFLDPNEFSGTVECTGSITATTINITCTVVDTIIGDCVGTFTYSIRGTRTNDDAFIVGTFSNVVTGSDPECSFFPPDCSQTNSHSHRTGPAPAAYCSTPARPETWGQVKIRYR